MSQHNISAKFPSGYTERKVPTNAGDGIGSKTRDYIDTGAGIHAADGIGSGDRFTVGNVSDTNSRNQIKHDIAFRQATSTITDFNNTDTVSIYDLHDAGSEDDNLPVESTSTMDLAAYQAARSTAMIASANAAAFTAQALLLAAEESASYGGYPDTVTIGGEHDIKDDVNKFASNPRPPSRGTARASWGSIQAALQDRILPNELYEDEKGEYELTAYQITIFMLAEGEIFNKKLSELTKGIRTQADIESIGGVIIAQTAGTDEFYIEDFEFESIVGGGGPIATKFTFTIKSPYQADLVDHIFKAAKLLQIRNHHDIPFFVLLNWNARTTDTSAPKHFDTSRCFSFRIQYSSLSYDDSGGLYEITAVRYAEHNFNQSYMSLLEDITIEGHSVIEMIEQLLIRIGSVYSKAIDNILLPDVWRIDLDKEIAPWPMVKPKQADKSDVKAETNRLSNAEKTVAGSRHYIHAEDVAEALLFLYHYDVGSMKADETGAKCQKFNIVGKNEIDNLQLAQFIAETQNKELNYEMVDFHSQRPGHDLRYALNGSKMANMGWERRIELEDGVRRTYQWFLRNTA